MKFIIAILLNILLTYAAYLYSNLVPWWSFAACVFLVGVCIPQKAWLGWLSGFLGVFVCWAALAIFINHENKSLLSVKMAKLLPLGGSAWAIITLTAAIGALVGGFAAMSGSLILKKR